MKTVDKLWIFCGINAIGNTILDNTAAMWLSWVAMNVFLLVSMFQKGVR